MTNVSHRSVVKRLLLASAAGGSLTAALMFAPVANASAKIDEPVADASYAQKLASMRALVVDMVGSEKGARLMKGYNQTHSNMQDPPPPPPDGARRS